MAEASLREMLMMPPFFVIMSSVGFVIVVSVILGPTKNAIPGATSGILEGLAETEMALSFTLME